MPTMPAATLDISIREAWASKQSGPPLYFWQEITEKDHGVSLNHLALNNNDNNDDNKNNDNDSDNNKNSNDNNNKKIKYIYK